jgi:predicted O-linked N-acetylglucosamine transferase (SPINDLY family)
MLPILANHDRNRFEITAYSANAVPDAFGATLGSHCERWRETTGMPDEMLAQRIRSDNIDILIDLSLHMGGSRLLAFARRPAPVQVTYLAYASTSGMSAMDWRLSDPHLDPPENDTFYTERTARLASSYWCYHPPPEASDVAPRHSGPISFACTNNIFKVTDATLRAWAKILAAVPSSRLLLHAQVGRHTDQILRLLNVDHTRVVFIPFVPFKTYLRAYTHMDILLDPFPYAGGTTTCDAMWMGVPVVTLAGQTAVQRGGVSLLRNIGLPELVANDVDQYIAIATDLAQSPQRLAELRSTLRGRMESSVLMNAHGFVRDFESALRQIWHHDVLFPP